MRPGIGEMRVFPSIWGHWAGGEFDFLLLFELCVLIADEWMYQVLVTAKKI
jgi:hypothetical protein